MWAQNQVANFQTILHLVCQWQLCLLSVNFLRLQTNNALPVHVIAVMNAPILSPASWLCLLKRARSKITIRLITQCHVNAVFTVSHDFSITLKASHPFGPFTHITEIKLAWRHQRWHQMWHPCCLIIYCHLLLFSCCFSPAQLSSFLRLAHSRLLWSLL